MINKEIALFLSKNGFQVKVLTSDSLGVRCFKDLIKPLKVKNSNNKDKKVEVIRLSHNIILGFYLYFKYKLFNFLDIVDDFYLGPIIDVKLIKKFIIENNLDIIVLLFY